MTNPTQAHGDARGDKPASPPRRSVWDSPWYWLYLFATAGLIGLLLIGPKFAARQAQIESSGLKRQRAAMQVRGKHVLPEPTDPATEDSPEQTQNTPASGDDGSAETTEIGLQPLYVLLVILVVCGGAGVFWQHWRQHRAAVSSTPAKPTGPEA